jgi:hypothetical protein
MSEAKGRLWGIDVIAGIYGLTALLMGALYFIGDPRMQMLALVLGLMSGAICIGMIYRVNKIRIGLVALLAIGLVGEAMLFVYFVLAVCGVARVPTNMNPMEKLPDIIMRAIGAAVMFFYLRRPDVREAFRCETVDSDEQTKIGMQA